MNDLAAARHLATALAAHRVRVERDGGAVPDSLRLLEHLASFRVTGGQEGSVFGASDSGVDDQAMTPRLLTFRQVADALGVSESSVKRVVDRGELPAVKVGGAVRVRTDDLDSYVAGLGRKQVSA